MSNFSYSPITLPVNGTFLSVEGYWYWILTRDDRLRGLWGYEAKKLGKSLPIKEDVVNFEDLIKGALDIKLKSNKEKLVEFALSELPLTHYYVFNGVVKDAGYKWILEHFEERRKLLKSVNYGLK